jgi:hypothetical protein
MAGFVLYVPIFMRFVVGRVSFMFFHLRSDSVLSGSKTNTKQIGNMLAYFSRFQSSEW